MFAHILGQFRKSKGRGPDPNFVNFVAKGYHSKKAFVDPNDPSTFYVD